MKVCLHLGFHKTGTTHLQEKLFPFHPDIEYWGKEWKNKKINDVAMKHIFNSEASIATGKPSPFDNNKFMGDINSIVNLNKDKLNLFSEERLSSTSYYLNSTLEEGIERISKTFNSENIDLKILLVIRNQSDFLISRYAENKNIFYKVNKKWNSFKNLKKSLKKKEKISFEEKSFLDNYKYYSFIKILEKYFEPKNIRVLFYEDLLRNSDQFYHNICNFLNIKNIPIPKKKTYRSNIFFGYYEDKHNKFNSTRILNLNKKNHFNKLPSVMKILINFIYDIFFCYPNHILQSIFNGIKKDKEYSILIKEYYKDDNKKLEKYFDRDLKRIGY
jgi:hypothetical protein